MTTIEQLAAARSDLAAAQAELAAMHEHLNRLRDERDALRAEVEQLGAQRSDLAQFAGRLIRRLRAAREGSGISAGDEALVQQIIGYLRRKGIVSPLRDEAAASAPKEG